MTFLFVVEDSYLISGKGLVLTPGLNNSNEDISSGMTLLLRRPNKSEIESKIQGISFEGETNVLLDRDTERAQVPVGTEVWLLK